MPVTLDPPQAKSPRAPGEEGGGVIRMSLDLTPQMKSIIDQLSNETGRSRADVLRQAIALLKVVKDAENKNEAAALIDEGGKVVARLINI